MRPLLFVVAVGIAGSAASVLAQDLANTSDTVRVAAEAPPGCVVSRGAASQGALNATFTPDGSGGGAVAISQLVNPQTSEPRASQIELMLPVVCNAAHRLVIASDTGGLLRAGGATANTLSPDAFADLLPYTIGLEWGGTAIEAASDRTATLQSAQPARNGELRLRIGTSDGGGLLTAGNYSDSITIRFEPAS